MLITPCGQKVALTPKELTFMALLAGVDVCDHDRLAKGLGDGGDFNSSSLTTLVRRLRQKVDERAGEEPPIRAIYGKGYGFAAPLSLR
ncbi:helix-turn-helix domain-containing protein [Nitrospirillum sp. BR 11752]|uniref:helix-turn-helix domain-containing protein n=1 Tax=Nitrospirillum sp. BR 11752 TaxID=3104293 RepID=UPI002EAB9B60|nr:helix-turn-helix domain-containing protein [Nitrospirillum sp. BR 11752]